MRSHRRLVVLAALTLCVGACDTTIPLQPVNRTRPVVVSLTAFPTTIGPTDSAIVVCIASDADGDTVVYDWTSDCRMIKKGGQNRGTLYHQFDRSLVVYPGACNSAPVDTGWVSCFVRDQRGGGTSAGTVRIIVRQ